MRLFVAIPLPEDVKQSLEELQQPVEGIRWQRFQQYHITLRFIGEVDRATAQTIREDLKLIHVSSFNLDIEGPGYFPENQRPRVIWVGVKETSGLMKLQKEIEQVCQKAGLEPERRDFKPHVTLGKVKGAFRQDVLSFIERNKQFGAANIPVSEFILYYSQLQSDGAVHEPLERYSLA